MPKPTRTPERIEYPNGWYWEQKGEMYPEQGAFYMPNGARACDMHRQIASDLYHSMKPLLMVEDGKVSVIPEAALQSPAGEWRSAKTLPRNGTPVLIWDGYMICVATCEDKVRPNGTLYTLWHGVGESGHDSERDFDDPLAWLPLPPFPTGEAE